MNLLSSAVSPQWTPDLIDRVPAFIPLRRIVRALPTGAWPACEDFNAIAGACHPPLENAAGKPLRFVPQETRQATFEDKFEPRVYMRGEVQMRPCNWHDTLNALVWLTFPRSKAALNERHYRALIEQRASGALNRTPAQDVLTLFDEGGVIVVSSNGVLGDLLRDGEWKELFWRRRSDVISGMRFYLFGHALYEKMLHPYPGVTARGVLHSVAPDFFDLPVDRQLDAVDASLADRLAQADQWRATRELMAVPLLGIPGWDPANATESYYENTTYFRQRLA
jgi:hypothetical protein